MTRLLRESGPVKEINADKRIRSRICSRERQTTKVRKILSSRGFCIRSELPVEKVISSPLRGTLTKMEWVNPHGWIYIDVKEPDGQGRELGD